MWEYKIKKTIEGTKNSTDQMISSIENNLTSIDDSLIRTIDENKKELYHSIDELRSSCKSYTDSRFDRFSDLLKDRAYFK
jgi:hypothetical protein